MYPVMQGELISSIPHGHTLCMCPYAASLPLALGCWRAFLTFLTSVPIKRRDGHWCGRDIPPSGRHATDRTHLYYPTRLLPLPSATLRPLPPGNCLPHSCCPLDVFLAPASPSHRLCQTHYFVACLIHSVGMGLVFPLHSTHFSLPHTRTHAARHTRLHLTRTRARTRATRPTPFWRAPTYDAGRRTHGQVTFSTLQGGFSRHTYTVTRCHHGNAPPYRGHWTRHTAHRCCGGGDAAYAALPRARYICAIRG